MKKSTSKNNFNAVAPIYDTLAKVVFNGHIEQAQAHYLDRIAANSRVLVVGGGTGKILSNLEKLNRRLEVTYVEPSSGMMKRAIARAPFQHLKVDFKQSRHDSLEEHKKYDVIITAFFLDLFSEKRLREVMKRLACHLSPGGQWLCTDFIATDKYWQNSLLKIMYWFFRLTTDIESRSLIHFDDYFRELKFVVQQEKTFYSGMIRTCIFKGSC